MRRKYLLASVMAATLVPISSGVGFADVELADGSPVATVASDDMHAIPWAARPIQMFTGKGSAFASLSLPNGPDLMGDVALFNYVGLKIGGNYGVIDKLEVGGQINLAVITPDQLENFGAITAYALYSLFSNEQHQVSAGAEVGAGFPPSLGATDYDLPQYFDFDGVRFGVAPEIRYRGVFGGKFALRAGLRLPFVANGAFDPVAMEEESYDTVQVRAEFIATVNEVLGFSARTGIDSADDYSFDKDEGAKIPFLVGALYQGVDKLDLGVWTGFRNLTTPSGQDLTDTFNLTFDVRYYF